MKSPFRSIRQVLFNEGKLLRYLGYAIGEVVLIIVGILIALKINDWNEDRKAQGRFDEYIVQLREDVRQAILSNADAMKTTDFFEERMKFILEFVDNPNREPESIQHFENGLDAIGKYSKGDVRIGLLGQIMDGNMDVISRDRELVRKTMEVEGKLEKYRHILDQQGNQIDLATVSLYPFRGSGSRDAVYSPRYDLDHLVQSKEFINTVQSIYEKMQAMNLFNGNSEVVLEEFLEVLEEYE